MVSAACISGFCFVEQQTHVASMQHVPYTVSNVKLRHVCALAVALGLFMCYVHWTRRREAEYARVGTNPILEEKFDASALRKATESPSKQAHAVPRKISTSLNVPRPIAMDAQQHKAALQKEYMAAVHDPPEVRRLKQLLTTFQSPQRTVQWDALLAIGDVYARGAYPRFRPNASMAMRCYKLAATCPDGDVAGTGQVKYMEARLSPIHEADITGAELPTTYGQHACDLALQRIRMTPMNSFQKPIAKKLPGQVSAAMGATAPRHPDDGDTAAERNLPPTQRPRVAPPAAAHRLDTQNVHDHAVVTSLKHNLKALASNLNEPVALPKDHARIYGTLESVRDYVLTGAALDSREKADALQTLDALSKDTHSTMGASEVDALRIVWTRIQGTRDKQTQENLKETLAKQLASGVEKGHVVCSTGRIARIVGTLDGIEEAGATQVRPLWAVKEEIASMAARVRDQVLRGRPAADVQGYERGQRPDIEADMKRSLTSEAVKTYCEDLGMNREIIMPIISQYADAF